MDAIQQMPVNIHFIDENVSCLIQISPDVIYKDQIIINHK